MILPATPQPASWNRSTHPDQIRLRGYLDRVKELAQGRIPDGPWCMRVAIGLPTGRDLLAAADLDNYLLPLARGLDNGHLVCVVGTKSHSPTSTLTVSPAR